MRLQLTNIKKNIIANYVGQTYSIFIGIIILPLYLNYLGPEAYGLVGFFTTMQSWLILLDMGLTQTLTREIAREKSNVEGCLKFKQILRSSEILFLIIALSLIFSIFISKEWIANSWLQIDVLSIDIVQESIVLMSIMIGFRLIVGIYKGVTVGLEDQVWLSGYNVVINSIKFIGAFLVIKYVDQNIMTYFYYMLAATLLEFFAIQYRVYSKLPKTRVVPTINSIRSISRFSLSIAFVSSIWIVITQLDKVMLSHYLTLENFGYFSIVAILSNGILQLYAPIAQALQPRMVALFAESKTEKMISVYREASRLTALIIFSVVSMVSMFSNELIYAWTGNTEAADFGGPLLFWYAMGSGIISILSFQYYLQYAHGNLKYHIRGSAGLGILQAIALFIAIYYYKEYGAAIASFCMYTFSFIFWTAYIHSKFAPGLHKKWLFYDVLPYIVVSALITTVIKSQYQLPLSDRFSIFLILIFLGIIVLLGNLVVYFASRRLKFIAN